MANDKQHTELIWEGKFVESAKLPKKRKVEKINLPFQTIEVINEPREGTGIDSFDFFTGKKKEGWKNKLIWGDNKLVLSSLLKDFEGKIDLIYIDPPFDVGADFSVKVKVGDEEINKEPSIIEEKAYNDTWGSGTNSWIQMMYERLILVRDLLKSNGSIYVHCDWRVSALLRLVMNEVFGESNFINEIVWSRRTGKTSPDTNRLENVVDYILWYSKSKDKKINFQYSRHGSEDYIKKQFRFKDKDGRRYRISPLNAPAPRPTLRYEFMGYRPHPNGWSVKKEVLERYYKEGRLVFPKDKKGRVNRKQYLDEWSGYAVNSLWTDISVVAPSAKERLDYPTQKPESLLERIIKMSSNEQDIVADFFSGSGTTGAVAEKLNRKWIMCDLGRFAIHTSRKRLMELQRDLKSKGKDFYPFEILNLGKYERQQWQFSTNSSTRKTSSQIGKYIRFIVELYKGEVVRGYKHIHGKKDGRFIHIGAVDAPVTMNEIQDALNECESNNYTKLDILGWEWEMGVNEEAIKIAKDQKIHLKLLNIPREVMDKRAVEIGDIRFFELNYVDIKAEKKGNEVKVTLKKFAIESDDLIPEDIREKIKEWQDYVDYWSIDWDYASKKDADGNYIFENDWQTFRTRQQKKLELETPWHKYSKKGKYTILVKVIDIFGNDTSKVVEIKI